MCFSEIISVIMSVVTDIFYLPKAIAVKFIQIVHKHITYMLTVKLVAVLIATIYDIRSRKIHYRRVCVTDNCDVIVSMHS